MIELEGLKCGDIIEGRSWGVGFKPRVVIMTIEAPNNQRFVVTSDEEGMVNLNRSGEYIKKFMQRTRDNLC